METLSFCIARAAMPSNTLLADQCRTTFCPPQATGDIPMPKFTCCAIAIFLFLLQSCAAQQHGQCSAYDSYSSDHITADNCMSVLCLLVVVLLGNACTWDSHSQTKYRHDCGCQLSNNKNTTQENSLLTYLDFQVHRIIPLAYKGCVQAKLS